MSLSEKFTPIIPSCHHQTPTPLTPPQAPESTMVLSPDQARSTALSSFLCAWLYSLVLVSRGFSRYAGIWRCLYLLQAGYSYVLQLCLVHKGGQRASFAQKMTSISWVHWADQQALIPTGYSLRSQWHLQSNRGQLIGDMEKELRWGLLSRIRK